MKFVWLSLKKQVSLKEGEILTIYAYVLFIDSDIEKVNHLENYEVDRINIALSLLFSSSTLHQMSSKSLKQCYLY